MTCSAAPKLAYGSIQESSSTFVNYTCDAGYSLQGNNYIECVNGVWNMTDYPICLFSLEQYSNSGMSVHSDSNTTTETTSELSTWFVYGLMGSGGCLALPVVAFFLLACCHICGFYPGPVVAIGGRYQVSDRRCYSVFNWCDFMVKGKVCKKIRKMNKSKAIGPGSDSLDIEDETGDKTDELGKEKAGQPPGDADSESQYNDISSSTSGYASSSPSASPLPEEESLLPDNEDIPDKRAVIKSPRDSNAVIINIEEDEKTDKKRGAKKAQGTKPKTKQSRSTSDNAEQPNHEETDSAVKPTATKTVKKKTKQLKK